MPSLCFDAALSSFGVREVLGGFVVVVFKRANNRLSRSLRRTGGNAVRNCGWNSRNAGRMVAISKPTASESRQCYGDSN